MARKKAETAATPTTGAQTAQESAAPTVDPAAALDTQGGAQVEKEAAQEAPASPSPEGSQAAQDTPAPPSPESGTPSEGQQAAAQTTQESAQDTQEDTPKPSLSAAC